MHFGPRAEKFDRDIKQLELRLEDLEARALVNGKDLSQDETYQKPKAEFGKRFGGQVLDTMGIENFASVPATEGPKLAAALEQHVREYAVEILNGQRAEELVPAGEPGGLVDVRLAGGASLRARSVVLSTGARWRNSSPRWRR